MNLPEDVERLKAVELAYRVISYTGLSPKSILILSIQEQKRLYDLHGEKEILEAAVLQIRVYCKMGYLYDSQKVLFDPILSELNMQKKDVLPCRVDHAIQIKKLTKTRIRSMIKGWNVSGKQICTATQLVEEIYQNLVEHRNGVYLYNSEGDEKSMSRIRSYELVIREEECYFYDMIKDEAYHFSYRED